MDTAAAAASTKTNTEIASVTKKVRRANLSRWLVRDCPAATRDQTKEIVPSIPECASDDTDEQEFCENFVQRGTKSGLSIRLLVTQAIAVRKEAL
ncbi:unnamed protein product [Rotaria magnacalcarata]|uniref:Uncharacterized protein n=2 Tax=Rotaria magnacalcarata TaxID=392030 RepID=A0A815RCJ0_9BILA|nr:unnamed protein product [Rotaria magnacalcarata]